MTLVSSLITDAYREGLLIAVGKSPTADQITEGLRLYNALVKFMVGGEAGENFRDWPLGNYGRQAVSDLWLTPTDIANPPINSRLLCTAEAATTVYLHKSPSDGSRMSVADPHSRLAAFNVTLDANGRTIEQASTLVLSTDALQRDWFYRAELGDWVRTTSLVSTDQAPFPEDFDSLQIILLAMRLSPRYGNEIGAASLAVLKQQRQQFIARYSQTESLVVNPALSRNAVQGYRGQWYNGEGSLYGY